MSKVDRRRHSISVTMMVLATRPIHRLVIVFYSAIVCHGLQGTGVHSLMDINPDGSKSDTSFYFYQQTSYPKDCTAVQQQCLPHNSTGVFLVEPDGYLDPFEVYCDSTDGSGGWTVIQRRVDGSINFNRDWENYKSGFGFLSGEFWIGNEKLSFLTNQEKYQLVIQITTVNDTVIRLAYDNFRITDEFSDYRLVTLGHYYGLTDAIQFCAINMVFKNCTNVCQRSCESPRECQDGVCTEFEDCVCDDGFLMKGSDCVQQEQCGCYVSESDDVLPEGEFYISPGCTRKGVCTNGEIVWDESYACSANAVCDVRDSRRQCYCSGGYKGDGETCTRPPKDCQEIYEDGSRNNGIYRIKPSDWPGEAFEVYCNMSDGGGWTVFQRRVDGSEDFYLEWDDYKEGFGNLSYEFWLGNEKLFHLTNQNRYEIRVDLVNRDGAPYYAKFDYFRINDENDNYRLSGLGIHSGTADSRSNPDGLALRYNFNHQFSTKNRGRRTNCAVDRHGAWWYDSCSYSNLNGDYFGPRDTWRSVCWHWLPGGGYNLKFTEMKIRPV